MPTFKTIHTAYGLQRMAAAEATGKPINLTHMAVGDGNGNPVDPSEGQTMLVREMHRGKVNRVFQDPKTLTQFTAELIVPATVAGFTLREVGVFDADGGLFAVGNLPDTYKPNASEGAYSDTVVRLEFLATNAAIVTLQLDPNVAVATQTWISNNVTAGALLPGGTTGQVLRKKSNADGDTVWGDETDVNVLVSTIEELQTLTAGQTSVDLVLTTTAGLAVYIGGQRLPKVPGADGWQPDPLVKTKLVLGKSYPAGTKMIAAQNEPASHLETPLQQKLNLSDLPDKATARNNLGVYSRDETDQKAPVSMIAYFPVAIAPAGWLKANGAALSRTAYAQLYAKIGTNFGAGDGFNTFNLPDLRGEFIRGWDDGRGVDDGRGLLSSQAHQLGTHAHAATADTQGTHTHNGNSDTTGAHVHDGQAEWDGLHMHTGSTSEVGDHTHASGIYKNMLRPPYVGSLTGYDTKDSGIEQAVGPGDSQPMKDAGAHVHTLKTDDAGGHRHKVITNSQGNHKHVLSIDQSGSHTHKITVSATGGNETRPRNMALLACIKY